MVSEPPAPRASQAGADGGQSLITPPRVVERLLPPTARFLLPKKTLPLPSNRHPLGAWYHVASVYDGKEFRNYVDGVREGAGEVTLEPHGPGHTSVGVRINKVFYFKGAVHLARFSRRALSTAEFLKPPAK